MQDVGNAVSAIDKLNALMEHKQNYTQYRQVLKTAKQPVMPYLGELLIYVAT